MLKLNRTIQFLRAIGYGESVIAVRIYSTKGYEILINDIVRTFRDRKPIVWNSAVYAETKCSEDKVLIFARPRRILIRCGDLCTEWLDVGVNRAGFAGGRLV